MNLKTKDDPGKKILKLLLRRMNLLP